jgi:hypothetical protein
MSTNRASHRALAVFALLTALSLASLPVRAEAVRQPAPRLQAVAVFGDGGVVSIWRFFADLLPRGLRKEGVLIDPNGVPSHQGTTAGAVGDEGMTIDPNGHQ